MSKALDRLIVTHKQRLGRTRRYSSDQNLDNAFAELADALETGLKQASHIIQALDSDKQVAEVLAMEPKEYETVERELEKGNDEEKNSYRYKILPRIYSKLDRIDSSPQLARKLMSYYLRNRRKEKMNRLYGRKKHYSGRVMADYLVHEMYMELGRTLYFSWLNNIGAWIKNKGRDISILRYMYEAVRKLIDLASDALERLITSPKVEKWLAGLLSGGVMSGIAMLFIKGGIFESALNNLDTGKSILSVVIAGLGFLVSVLGGGYLAYMFFKGLISKVGALLRPKALMTYYKGYKLLTRFNKAFSVLLGDIDATELIDILAKFVKAATENDNSSKKSAIEIIQRVVDKINSDNNYGQFFTLSQQNINKIKSAIEQGEELSLRLDVQVLGDVLKTIKGEFNVGSHITMDYLGLTKGSEGDKSLPPELTILIVLTSPNITITLSAGSAGNVKTPITFNAWSFIQKHAEVQTEEVTDFLKTYMSAFAKKGDELSEYLKGKFEK